MSSAVGSPVSSCRRTPSVRLVECRAGVVAGMWNVRGFVVSGGISCFVSVALIASPLREFIPYDDRTNEHAVRQRELAAVLLRREMRDTNKIRFTKYWQPVSGSAIFSEKTVGHPA